MAKPKYVYVYDCPCPYDVAPYAYLVLRRADEPASSIYRGSDAAPMLHKKGKHTQAEIHADPKYANISNPEGFSEHDLHSDGSNANPKVPRGGKLEPWQVGIDSGTDSQASKDRITAAAHHYGLHVKHPYTRGVEGHHWCFSVQPHPNKHLPKWKVVAVRARLRLNK